MKYIKEYKSFNQINEEFVFSAIKGSLAKVMQAFSNTFKDFANDFKKEFKPDDPNSIKNIILTNFNQAVDGAQKMLGGNEVDENGVNSLMNTMVDNLVALANGLDKDVDTALGKDKSAGAKAIAKAILLGSKEAQWAGIVGLLDPAKGKSGIKTTYKYSKVAYEKVLTDAGSKGGSNALKARKDAAAKFLDNMQKDIVNQLNKEFSEEEVKKIYNDTMKKAGNGPEYKEGDQVIYLLKDKTMDDWNKLNDNQKKNPKEKPASDIVGIGKIQKIQDDKITIEYTEGKTTEKSTSEIISRLEVDENEEAKKAAESLGKIKQDPEKMKKVATFSDFIQDEKNKDKVAEIEKIMTGESGT